MLQLLLYQLAILLVPLGLLHALCGGGGGKKQRERNAHTGRSNMSHKSASTPGSKSNDEMLKTAVDCAGNGRLRMEDESKEPGTTTENKSGRISIHGAVHNTDTNASAEQIDEADGKVPTIEGIDQEKAAPGKVSIGSRREDNKKKKSVKEQQTPRESTCPSNKDDTKSIKSQKTQATLEK